MEIESGQPAALNHKRPKKAGLSQRSWPRLCS